MPRKLNRRRFLGTSLAATTGAAIGFNHEERILLAQGAVSDAKVESASPETLPQGTIGNLKISRLICGGNLISGFAHSRDLIYVSRLVKSYFTDEKVMETFQLCEQQGIDTAILRLDDNTLRIIGKHWNDAGGKLQWIAQIKPMERDVTSDIDRAVDHGALGVYIQGEAGDRFVHNGRVELIRDFAAHAKSLGVVHGVGAHRIETVIACEEAGIDTDFYMKTLNSKQYWSAGPEERFDSVWAETPEKTIEFFKTVDKPWIAFKVLGAGAIHPREGFSYAFENGADFICAGMFDFQVRDDANLVREHLALLLDRERPWRA